MRTTSYLLTTAMLMFLSVCQSLADELVMVEQHGCHWCERWNSDIAHIYPKTDEGTRAPLRRVDLHALPDDITFDSRPVFTPTFVLVREGKELARMEGYAGDEFFWFLLSEMLEAHPVAEDASQ
jgi:thioredoxin-related protein